MTKRREARGGAFAARTAGVLLSLALILGALFLASQNKLVGLQTEDQWLPFASCLVGVTLYVLSSMQKRGERFNLFYLPDYAYRAAQAFVYLYATLAIMKAFDVAGELAKWPPNLIGLFVGMFILHAEKAMEGLGQRFEEALTALLGRSLAAPTSRERDAELVRAEDRVREIQKQAGLLASQTGNTAVIEGLRKRLDEVKQTISDGDYDAILRGTGDLVLDFEMTKEALRHEALTVEKVVDLMAGPAFPPPGGGRRSRGGAPP